MCTCFADLDLDSHSLMKFPQPWPVEHRQVLRADGDYHAARPELNGRLGGGNFASVNAACSAVSGFGSGAGLGETKMASMSLFGCFFWNRTWQACWGPVSCNLREIW